MKAEEILKNTVNITEQTKYHNYAFLYRSILIAMNEFAKQEAIDFSKWQRNNKEQYKTSEQLYTQFKLTNK